MFVCHDPSPIKLDCLVEITGTGKGGKSSLQPDVTFEAGKGEVKFETAPDDITGLFKLVGLGNNKGLAVVLQATAVTQGQTVCTNHGQQIVEAQPRTMVLQASLTIPPENFDKNGQVTGNVPITPQDILSQLKPSVLCPNDNWTLEIETLLWQGPADIIHTQQGPSETESFVCEQTALLDVGETLACKPVE